MGVRAGGERSGWEGPHCVMSGGRTFAAGLQLTQSFHPRGVFPVTPPTSPLPRARPAPPTHLQAAQHLGIRPSVLGVQLHPPEHLVRRVTHKRSLAPQHLVKKHTAPPEQKNKARRQRIDMVGGCGL